MNRHPLQHPDSPAAGPTSNADAPAIVHDSIRDTIDSIVVAFILAFVFRAFIVEAFVIPTGSMAPSLYGMHGQHRCANCSYTFAYGIREPIQSQDVRDYGTLFTDRGEIRSFSVRCPNCSWDGEGNSELNVRQNHVVPDSGDRILVLKWPYDVGGPWLGPKRWDVVVFKNPQDGEVNFIKRLLGLPGEVLQIINGDVFAAPIKSVPDDIVKALDGPVPHDPLESRLTDDQMKRLAKVMKIQRKPRVARDSLWMLHYDHDFVPHTYERDRVARYFDPPRWTERDSGPAAAWSTRTPRIIFKPADTQTHWIDLTGSRIEDEYGYNNTNYDPNARNSTPPRAVGDVLLSFVLFPDGSEGELSLMLSKGKDRFQAHLASDGTIRLERFNDSIRGGFWEEIRKSNIAPLAAKKPIEIEFENLDFRIALRINGDEVLATDDAQYSPNLEDVLKRTYEDGHGQEAHIAIGAKLMTLEIRHLKVQRDVYYRSDRIIEPSMFNGAPGWGTALNPILLREQPQDFFCCGDNSPQSKDSRLWTEVCALLRNRQPPNEYRYGTVPGDQLIGQAFFVYWPSGLRFSKNSMAVIPNVGRMRMIR